MLYEKERLEPRETRDFRSRFQMRQCFINAEQGHDYSVASTYLLDRKILQNLPNAGFGEVKFILASWSADGSFAKYKMCDWSVDSKVLFTYYLLYKMPDGQ